MTVKNYLTNLVTNLLNENISTIKNIVIIDLQINSNNETSIFIIKCKKEALIWVTGKTFQIGAGRWLTTKKFTLTKSAKAAGAG